MIALNQTKKPAKWCPGLTRNIDLTRGLAGYYPLWEGAGGVLGGMRGPDGSRNNAVWGTGAAGHCLTFDGNDQYATLPASVGSVTGGSAWTWSCWYYTRDNRAVVMTNQMIGAQFNGHQYQVKKLDDSIQQWAFSPRLPTNRWIHVALTHDLRAGVGAKLYVDGTLSQQDTAMTESVKQSVTIMNIGGHKDTAYGHVYWLDGGVADVAIYDRAISAGEVARLYRRPFGLCRPARDVWSIPLAEAPYRVAVGNVWHDGAEAGGQHLTGTGAGIALVDGQQAGRTHG